MHDFALPKVPVRAVPREGPVCALSRSLHASPAKARPPMRKASRRVSPSHSRMRLPRIESIEFTSPGTPRLSSDDIRPGDLVKWNPAAESGCVIVRANAARFHGCEIDVPTLRKFLDLDLAEMEFLGGD